jgi:hypothetical protein
MTGDRPLWSFPRSLSSTPIGERESRAQADFYREFPGGNYPEHSVVTSLFVSLKNIEQSRIRRWIWDSKPFSMGTLVLRKSANYVGNSYLNGVFSYLLGSANQVIVLELECSGIGYMFNLGGVIIVDTCKEHT